MKCLLLALLAVGGTSFLSFAHLDETGSKTETKKADPVPAPAPAVRKVSGAKSSPTFKKRTEGLFKRRDGKKVRPSLLDRKLELEESLDDPKSRAQLELEFMKHFQNIVRGTITTRGKDLLEIDLKKGHGAKVGDSVMTIEGLLGVINEVEEESCLVGLITHPDSRISVRLPGTRDQAYLCGGGDGKVKLTDSTIGKKERPSFGAALMTSHEDHLTKKANTVPANFTTVEIIDDPKSKSGWGLEVVAPIAKIKSVIILRSEER